MVLYMQRETDPIPDTLVSSGTQPLSHTAKGCLASSRWSSQRPPSFNPNGHYSTAHGSCLLWCCRVAERIIWWDRIHGHLYFAVCCRRSQCFTRENATEFGTLGEAKGEAPTRFDRQFISLSERTARKHRPMIGASILVFVYFRSQYHAIPTLLGQE